MTMTVRLYPLVAEHTFPLLLDAGFFTVCFGAWLLIFGNHFTGAVLALVVLFHVVQVAWLVAVRFGDDGITIIRPWRRRHVAWSQIAGLIYTRGTERRRRGRRTSSGSCWPATSRRSGAT